MIKSIQRGPPLQMSSLQQGSIDLLLNGCKQEMGISPAASYSKLYCVIAENPDDVNRLLTANNRRNMVINLLHGISIGSWMSAEGNGEQIVKKQTSRLPDSFLLEDWHSPKSHTRRQTEAVLEGKFLKKAERLPELKSLLMRSKGPVSALHKRRKDSSLEDFKVMVCLFMDLGGSHECEVVLKFNSEHKPNPLLLGSEDVQLLKEPVATSSEAPDVANFVSLDDSGALGEDVDCDLGLLSSDTAKANLKDRLRQWKIKNNMQTALNVQVDTVLAQNRQILHLLNALVSKEELVL
ncbi:unnamed protein product [Cyprideis torosa]|uniref:Uncharacterized protein n=1 Tax=Cyprideis torosa TaxID=163714 RepID=A0A7R8WKG9_9CRUS|nr:unnamed protein product [Cyprideis torosa]CAG0903110.1 unnamed protein product [Cyprideis torosa]